MSRIFTDSRGLNDAIDSAFESVCLIYRQGSSFTGPLIYNDWDDLMAAKVALEGEGVQCFRIGFDDTDVDPARITFPTGVYDMSGVEWFNARITGTSGFVFLDTSGAEFQHLSKMVGIQVRHNSSTVPFTFAGGGVFRCENALFFNDGASPTTPAIGGFLSSELLALRGFISFSEDSGIVCDVPAGATLSMAFSNQEVGRDTIGGAGVWLYTPINDAFFNPDQPNFSGLFLPIIFGMNYIDLPAVATSAKTVTTLDRPSAKHRYDTSGGAIAQSIPSAANRPGVPMEFHRDGASDLTLVPASGESIDGAAPNTPYLVADGSTVRLIPDGTSDYDVTVFE